MCSKDDSQGRELPQQQGREQESEASCEQREHLQQQNCEGLRGEAVGNMTQLGREQKCQWGREHLGARPWV
jgi:hypothetical protein